jgi:hypothetical protein
MTKLDTVTAAMLATISTLQNCKREDLHDECMRAKMIVEASKTVILAEQVNVNALKELPLNNRHDTRTLLQHRAN